MANNLKIKVNLVDGCGAEPRTPPSAKSGALEATRFSPAFRRLGARAGFFQVYGRVVASSG